MNWDAIGAVGEVVGAIAVVVSIVYLSIQIRQNTRTTKLSVEKDIATEWAHIGFDQAATSLPYIYVRGSDDLTKLSDEEMAQFGFYVSGLFQLFQLSYDQRCDGNLSDRSWGAIESWFSSQYQSSGVRAYWKVRSNTFKKEFQNYIESMPINESNKSAAAGVAEAREIVESGEA